MAITFVMFKDMKIKIDRPESIKQIDKDICCRAYELLKKIDIKDDWTEMMDGIFADNNIKCEIADEKEFEKFIKKANDFTLRV